MSLEHKTEWGTAPQDITRDEDFTKPEGKELKRVDLACGQRKKEGYTGIDLVATDKTDIVHNLLSFPWPLEDDSVYEFNCSHFVEHIPITLKDDTYGMNRFMEEVYRCLMPGGTITIHAPYYTSMRAWQDPTHTRAICDRTFDYYNKKQVESMGVDHYTAKCNFEIVVMRYLALPENEALAEEAKRWRANHYWNTIADIEFVLRKIPM